MPRIGVEDVVTKVVLFRVFFLESFLENKVKMTVYFFPPIIGANSRSKGFQGSVARALHLLYFGRDGLVVVLLAAVRNV